MHMWNRSCCMVAKLGLWQKILGRSYNPKICISRSHNLGELKLLNNVKNCQDNLWFPPIPRFQINSQKTSIQFPHNYLPSIFLLIFSPNPIHYTIKLTHKKVYKKNRIQLMSYAYHDYTSKQIKKAKDFYEFDYSLYE